MLQNKFFHYSLYIILVILAFRLPIKFPTIPSTEFSWMQALTYASLNGLVWGKDVFLQYGPWHMVSTRLYNPDFYPILVFSQLYVWLVFGWFFASHYFESRSKKKILIPLFIFFSCVYFYNIEMFFVVISYIFFSKAVSPHRRDRIITCLLLLLSGMFTLTKLTLVPVYIGLMILADIYSLIKYRRFPIYSICVVVSFILFWLISGHELSQLMPYLKNVAPFISEYSVSTQSAAQSPTPFFYEISFYIIILVLLFIIMTILINNFKQMRLQQQSLNLTNTLTLVIPIIAIMFYCFICIKIGFTRQDSVHMQLSTTSLLMLVFILMLENEYIKSIFNLKTVKNSVLSLLSFFILYRMFFLFAFSLINVSILGSFSTFYLFSPKTLDKAHADYWESLHLEAKELAKDVPLGEIQGSVDFYPIEITTGLALGLNYNPRPMIITYTAYSPELQEANLAHLRKEDAPNYLFYSAGTLDNRVESLALGPSLLEIFSRYEVKAKTEKMGLILKRKDAPLTQIKKGEQKIHVKDIFNETFDIPLDDDKNFVVMTVDMQLSFAGKLLATILKGPRVMIDLINEDEVVTKRFIPTSAQTGFVISPRINSTDRTYQAFKDIETGSILNNHTTKKVRFHIDKYDRFFEWAYKKEAFITFTSYQLEK